MASGLSNEATRLATFRSLPSPAAYSVTPSAMARAGLYYTGEDGITACFSCKGKFRSEDMTEPVMEVHRRKYPSCNFVKGTDRNNIPLGSTGKHTEENSQKSKEDDEPNNKQNKGTNSRKMKKKKKTSGKDESNVDGLVFDLENDPQLKEADRVLKSEYKRLLTFIYWPRNAPVLQEDLAKAGFYYLGEDDKVQCLWCGGILKDWRPDDVPINDHRYYFPSCKFAKGEDVGNEPMRLTTSQPSERNYGPVERQRLRDPSRIEVIGRNRSERDAEVDAHVESETSTQAQEPKHPKFARIEARSDSFRNWPNGSLPQEYLTQAGFFFTGRRDIVQCFHCGGKLENWEAICDPWIEHARWFPQCQFVSKHRGTVFMKYVKDKHPRPNAQPAKEKTGHDNGAMSIKELVLVAQQVNDFMKTDTVQVVLDMGYSDNMVKLAIRKHLKQTGRCFRSAEDLLEAVFDLEEGHSDDKDEELLGAVGGGASVANTVSCMPYEDKECCRGLPVMSTKWKKRTSPSQTLLSQ
ncbi:baculoviral IAP repeat-containing protein 7-like [Ptychodera flava]|uniref:baculoviral IAP repeat-containing protein 7-like n=1 Tax=Ptychodera flava TaxID=63121 RepID=UPI00396AA866